MREKKIFLNYRLCHIGLKKRFVTISVKVKTVNYRNVLNFRINFDVFWMLKS